MIIKSDIHIAKSFINALTGSPDSSMTWQTFDDDAKRKSKKLTRIIHGPISEVADQLLELNDQGAGIFVCPNETDGMGRKLENVVRVTTAYIDKDDGVPRSFGIRPNIFVTTKQGCHLYWLLSKEIESKKFNEAAKRLIAFYDADPAIKQSNSVLRVPGFLHQKDPKAPLLITFELWGDEQVLVDDLLAAHPLPGSKKKSSKITTPGVSSDTTIFDLDKLSAESGSRNETTLKLVRSSIAKGLSKDQIQTLVLDYVKRCELHPSFLLSPFTKEEALQILEDQWVHPDRDTFYTSGSDSDNRYFVRGNALMRREYKKDGSPTDVPCADFHARIIEEKTYDNGAEDYKILTLSAVSHDGRETIVDVPASEFSNRSWVDSKLGADFVIEPGKWEKFYAGIKMLSKGFKKSVHHAHTGFKKIDSLIRFLMPNGSISLDGFSEEPKAIFHDRSIPPFEFAGLLADEDRTLAKKFLNGFFKVAPVDISFPLIAAAVRAPLNPFKLVDFSVFLEGPSGGRKSTLAALACSFIGARFDRTNLAGNFTSTPNALEAIAFKFKDLIQVIDDFAPRGGSQEIAKYNSNADRIFRNIGNGSGRSRMTASGDLRANLPPRGLVVATGEDVPSGHSIQARLLVLSIAPDSVDVEMLTTLQKIALEGLPSRIFGSYIKYICENWEQLKSDVPKVFDSARARYLKIGRHTRFPENIANLYVGLWCFFEFCICEKIYDATEVQELKKQWIVGIKRLALREKALSKESDIALQFVEFINGAFDSNKAYLADPVTADQPTEPMLWGWSADGDRKNRTISFREGRAEKIGWVDSEYVYLLPKPSFAAAHESAKSLGINFNITESVLHRRLAQRGLIVTPETDTHLTKVSAEKRRPRVLKFRREVFRKHDSSKLIASDTDTKSGKEVIHAPH